ncbi:hypothetical protein [Leucobacter ruminantium]|uniref:Uncharacterized protein n=1 Tax=Leucobacter ruminantium TaxID=1289170 RepID=A0A939LWX0_9MICO|nr:hypothetical protein [Leucobacter ruminantium]MBO1806215.1 hypothetical protein [Leucobacter ruminantium]
MGRVRAGAKGARDLARMAELLCERGIELRSEGWCLGVPRIGEIGIDDNGAVLLERSAGAARRHAAHVRRGHGAGCAELGVPRETLERLLRSWDRVGAAELVLEAVDLAIAELAGRARVGAWSPEEARDAVAHALRSRLTPEKRAAVARTRKRARRSSERRARLSAVRGQMPRSASN